MPFDTGGLEILEHTECLSLLARAPLGRIVFTDRALPAVLPVNFALDGEDVIIRTGAGSKLAAAARNAIVAFEADDYDPATRTGWSVVLVGTARVVTNPAELARLRTLPLEPWAPGPHDDFIRIRAGLLPGRRIRHGAPAS
ncbi:pyridoxamine 5'-phosphate oxidase family protein [Thermomonospora cellulosilytica]|uniref:Nitroimidazol reductase NimA-like FMN-containing flavoprotein (Pyridoxamine 5'-phosphate oxidase superfamily) n=1 Tax=Thermomonospora cellulosilytica TaxID=1411118 RepID=A0A7W3MVU7_9ACTN|nr:pyridoxamine 5'-phosphate oxidase family protein [Thermomonospora cellulosilytica]MBA9002764.1 nitroimidazol reductase NimA-like FMN-containing flavoprotein (pyridoxamine 5'-phosphate oxidase superfamily) [Thermomonospora cellulosilytica]